VTDYGITDDGFRIKPFGEILAGKAARAKEAFGSDADLLSPSALRKILEITTAEDQELWKRMELFYYGNFVSTASGLSLDLLGQSLGIARRFLRSSGAVKLKLSNEAQGRTYQLPVGTVVETNAPVRFRTTERVSLSALAKEATVGIEALERGPAGDVAAGAINKINALFALRKLNLGGADVAVANDNPTSGGALQEDDETYRDLLLGHPRTMWTVESVRRTAREVDGVRDCRVFDPLGGVDVSLSKFNLFQFSRRRFGTQRFLGTPYFFDVLVAVQPGFLWETEAGVTGVKQAVEDAIRDVRPISIFPNVRPANEVAVGIRARVTVRPGHDTRAAGASIKSALEQRVNSAGLGSAVLQSEVVRDIMGLAGIVDIQQLHLRRNPPRLGTISFGSSERFQAEVVEAAIGENIELLPDEIAVFRVDSPLIDLEVHDR
jgi:uncharacterized phage protein gp47/JayE